MGRFRNLIKSTVVPAKRMKFDASATQYMPTGGANSTLDYSIKHAHKTTSYIPHLYEDLPPTSDPAEAHKHGHSHGAAADELTSFNSKFGLLLPNPAPDVAPADEAITASPANDVPGGGGSHGGQHVEGKSARLPIVYILSHI